MSLDDQHDSEMAPANLEWHRLYVRNSMQVGNLLDELTRDTKGDGLSMSDHATTALTVSKGKIRASCSCGAQSNNLRLSGGAILALRVWRFAHRRV